MELSIHTRDIELTDDVRGRITRRLELSLDTFKDHVQNAVVYLVDLNGPKGGVDKLCHIVVRARKIDALAVREIGTTFDAALNRAARSLKYRLSEGLRAAESSSRESIRMVE